MGGVAEDTLGGSPEVYDGFVPRELVEHWQSSGQEHT